MPRRFSRFGTVTLAGVVILLTILLVLYPQQSFSAGVAGLTVFWDVVFPSLLPFFILSDIMLGLGVVNALGVLLEPLMRPLFSVPGVGAFALSMGLAAGYPMDAVITAKFRRGGLCSRIESERLLAFTNTADPLFMFGAVAVGMFKSPGLGILLAVAHYISAFVVGVTFKLYGRNEERRIRPFAPSAPSGHMFRRSYRELLRARAEDGRPFGKMLGDAVNDSVRTLLMIGGFIVFFAVFLKVLDVTGVLAILMIPFAGLFHLVHFDHRLLSPLMSGAFEIDIGSAATAAVSSPLIQKVAVVSAIIAWSGLSVHAQVASVLTGTDIRMRPYLIARLYHAALAAIIAFWLFKAGLGTKLAYAPAAISTMAPLQAGPVAHWRMTIEELGTWATLFALTLLLSLLIYFLRRGKWFAWRANARS